MTPTWTRKGLLWDPPGPIAWGRTHAALPALDPIEGDAHWLYFSSRDDRGRSHIGRAEVTLRDGAIEVVRFDPEPVLEPGALGAFDDSGVTMSCIVGDGERRLLFYSGWSLGVTVPFYFYVGLAVSEDGGGTFHRHSQAPLLERTATDPFLTASPWVVREGGSWRMWYVSGLDWQDVDGVPRHRYEIRHATSPDGLSWDRDGASCIALAPDEHAISRPSVIAEDGLYRMWFAARGERYLLGYAESDDGITWRRDDARAGLEPADSGWDSEMLCYPLVHRHDGTDYLLYNGNGYGRSGIGYAVGGDR